MKKVLLTLLITASQAVDATWECEMCILTGNTFCQIEPYGKYASVYPVYQANSANLARQCCDATNGCSNWGVSGVPAKSLFTCTDTSPDTLSAFVTCPFMENRCSATQTYTKNLVDTPSTVTISGLNANMASCTYKIIAETGAPGFNLNSAAPAASFMVAMWTEYDLSSITPLSPTSTWPSITQAFASAVCDPTTCI